MKPWIMLSHAELRDQRPVGEAEDVHFTESLASAIITEFSSPGDLVLDPFAGFGTTPYIACRLDRRAVAVEILPERAARIQRRLSEGAQVIAGDARELASLVTAPVDLCCTSPPYMTATGHRENPLTGYSTMDGDYQTYLGEIERVFTAVTDLLRPDGYAVVNVANLVSDGVITPLAWDIGRVIARHLTLRQEALICWDRQPPGVSADYCLVFQKASPVDPS
jgi:DNA modification methylase